MRQRPKHVKRHNEQCESLFYQNKSLALTIEIDNLLPKATSFQRRLLALAKHKFSLYCKPHETVISRRKAHLTYLLTSYTLVTTSDKQTQESLKIGS